LPDHEARRQAGLTVDDDVKDGLGERGALYIAVAASSRPLNFSQVVQKQIPPVERMQITNQLASGANFAGRFCLTGSWNSSSK
jgi:hypothetical protein